MRDGHGTRRISIRFLFSSRDVHVTLILTQPSPQPEHSSPATTGPNTATLTRCHSLRIARLPPCDAAQISRARPFLPEQPSSPRLPLHPNRSTRPALQPQRGRPSSSTPSTTRADHPTRDSSRRPSINNADNGHPSRNYRGRRGMEDATAMRSASTAYDGTATATKYHPPDLVLTIMSKASRQPPRTDRQRSHWPVSFGHWGHTHKPDTEMSEQHHATSDAEKQRN